jgi:hypothetical protein
MFRYSRVGAGRCRQPDSNEGHRGADQDSFDYLVRCLLTSMFLMTPRSLPLAVFRCGTSCPFAVSKLSAAKRATAQQFGYDRAWRGPGTQGQPDQLIVRVMTL